jgi:hypothetical protein
MNDLKIQILSDELHKEEPSVALPPSITDFLAKQKPGDVSDIDPFD